MAENDDDAERTEEPSFKKLEDAAKRGDVAKSQEVVTWFMLLAATIALFSFSGDMMSSLAAGLGRLIEHSHDVQFDGTTMQRVAERMLWVAAGAVAIPSALFVLAGIAGNLVQHRPVWSFHPIEPRLNKISPVAGFKRLFSLQSLFNFAKGLAKVMIVGSIMVVVLWPERGVLGDLVTTDPAAIMPLARLLSLKVFGAALGVLTLVAALDYAYQRHRWYERQRMTIKEVRDEYRQMEGDPAVRAKLRQVRIERGRKRMMQRLPHATVVITNPTHYAVALQYEREMPAPICVAKGQDRVALRIRSVAEEHGVPIVENAALARALHGAVEIDDEVPPEHYRAVAEVIGYVLRLGQRRFG